MQLPRSALLRQVLATCDSGRGERRRILVMLLLLTLWATTNPSSAHTHLRSPAMEADAVANVYVTGQADPTILSFFATHNVAGTRYDDQLLIVATRCTSQCDLLGYDVLPVAADWFGTNGSPAQISTNWQGGPLRLVWTRSFVPAASATTDVYVGFARMAFESVQVRRSSASIRIGVHRCKPWTAAETRWARTGQLLPMALAATNGATASRIGSHLRDRLHAC
jgi:hypothetical protein